MIKPITNYAEWERHCQRIGKIPLRRDLTSRKAFSTTAPTSLQFFQEGFADNNEERNTMQAANQLPGDTLLIGIECSLYVADRKMSSYVGTDATALAADIMAGFYQAGVFTLKSQGETFIEHPRPLIHMPKACDHRQVVTNGYKALVLTEAAPNTFPGATVSYTPFPSATVGGRGSRPFMLAPLLFLPENEKFQAAITFDTGAVNPIASSVFNDSTNPAYLEVNFICEVASNK